MDPDGRKFFVPLFHEKQNVMPNKTLYMGSTPSGKYDIDDEGNKIYTKRNTIGGYGCLFTEIYNLALSTRKKYCDQHNIKFNEPGINTYSPIDAYYSIYDHSNDIDNPYNESDANMTTETAKKLYYDVSGQKLNHLIRVTNKSTISTLLKVIKNSNKEVKVIGHCNGHFFTITDVADNGDLEIEMIHDPQVRLPGYESWYKQFDKKLKAEGVDELWIMD